MERKKWLGRPNERHITIPTDGNEDDEPADATAGYEKHQYQYHEEGDTHSPPPSSSSSHSYHHHNNNNNYPSIYRPLSTHYLQPQPQPQQTSSYRHHSSLPDPHASPSPLVYHDHDDDYDHAPPNLYCALSQGPYPTSRYHRRYYGNHCSPRHHHRSPHGGGDTPLGLHEHSVDHSTTHAHAHAQAHLHSHVVGVPPHVVHG
ncbi:hypothetical protein F4775DRAFT_539290 [Biscogniauxia sp. FL1348]|nr:hypothetical protein F4775DRAFT_539290 [Biscogniauxia sp. FL1348]